MQKKGKEHVHRAKVGIFKEEPYTRLAPIQKNIVADMWRGFMPAKKVTFTFMCDYVYCFFPTDRDIHSWSLKLK